jgi:hypothetical protein
VNHVAFSLISSIIITQDAFSQSRMIKFQIDSNLKSSCNIPITSSRFSLHNYVATRVEELISKFLLSQACHCKHPAASYCASTFICWEMLMEVSYFVFIPDCQGSFSYQGNITFSTSTQAPPWIQILLSKFFLL